MKITTSTIFVTTTPAIVAASAALILAPAAHASPNDNDYLNTLYDDFSLTTQVTGFDAQHQIELGKAICRDLTIGGFTPLQEEGSIMEALAADGHPLSGENSQVMVTISANYYCHDAAELMLNGELPS